MATTENKEPAPRWYADAKPGLLVSAVKGFSIGKGAKAPRITQFMRVVYRGLHRGEHFFSFSYGEEMLMAFKPDKFEPALKDGERQYVESEAESEAA